MIYHLIRSFKFIFLSNLTSKISLKSSQFLLQLWFLVSYLILSETQLLSRTNPNRFHVLTTNLKSNQGFKLDRQTIINTRPDTMFRLSCLDGPCTKDICDTPCGNKNRKINSDFRSMKFMKIALMVRLWIVTMEPSAAITDGPWTIEIANYFSF